MKSSDLMIGNLVTVNNPENWPLLKDVPLIVEGVNKCKPIEGIENTDYNVQLFDNSDFKTRYSATKTFSQFICFIEPIKLTEDWLLRFGFEKYEFDNGDLNQYRYNNRLIIIRDGKFTDYGTSTNFEYVYQLQNFYYAVTYKELVIQ